MKRQTLYQFTGLWRIPRDYGTDYYWRGHYLATTAGNYFTLRIGRERVLTWFAFGWRIRVARGWCDPNKRYGMEGKS
jgi:hypothetical protein